MTTRISIAKALQMAGYITKSGHCNKLKCYAVHAYHPKNPTSAAYIGKRLLDGSYTLYNAREKLVYTLKQKECGKMILPYIKNITPKIRRSVFMENDEFAYLCVEAGLKAPDLRKLFNVPKSEVLLWLNDDDFDDYHHEIPEKVILRVRKQLEYTLSMVERNVNFVLEKKPVLGTKILLLSYKTQKELSRNSPSLISINYHAAILRRTEIRLEKLGYKIETAYIKKSLVNYEGWYASLKDAILVIPIDYKVD
ncbi:MAG: hypothetical protein KBC72_03735 [Acinetobacter sp.]|jgi:hypothetical protein|nr:hypothetical protein [Nitrosomonas sp.]MBP9786686.1 hypothetical protein [Acinetobacter sp.]